MNTYINTHTSGFGSRAQLSKIDSDSLQLRFHNVYFSSSIRDLGFILNLILSLSDRVNNVHARVSTTYANSVTSANHSLMILVQAVPGLIMVIMVYIALSSTIAFMLQAIFNATVHLIRTDLQ